MQRKIVKSVIRDSDAHARMHITQVYATIIFAIHSIIEKSQRFEFSVEDIPLSLSFFLSSLVSK